MKLTLAVLIASLGCEAQRSCQERCARNCAGESKDCMQICMVHKCTAARCARGTLGDAIRSWCRPDAKSDALECAVRCNGSPQLSVFFNMQEIQSVSCLVSGELVANNQVIDKPLECRKPDIEIDEISEETPLSPRPSTEYNFHTFEDVFNLIDEIVKHKKDLTGLESPFF